MNAVSFYFPHAAPKGRLMHMNVPGFVNVIFPFCHEA